MSKKYYINDICKIYNISEHTLRYYDKKMVLNCFKRDQNGYRYLDENDLKKIELIICLKKTNLSLKEITLYLELVNKGDSTMKERYEIIKNQLKIAKDLKMDIELQIKYLVKKVDIFKKILNND
ncbi:MerR family transcriptional regulator [Spiroplasma turonicum]|uniref:MerR family transcriptional regulator n=1 Tax=Spiroplasma turonicum TaxID=216946 RepID=A0A0K1P6J8_9MOLU|nr:MerR family transcriptional regulator [Spiroplasma turonicum]AKU79910.1 MerR family transcriptional regulator [Spiroplasma turonicum]ALX70922.1 MerR family transcriptional regulator [Spiroplasma turonicum]